MESVVPIFISHPLCSKSGTKLRTLENDYSNPRYKSSMQTFRASNTLQMHLIIDSKYTFGADAEKKNVHIIGIPLLLSWPVLAGEIVLANKKPSLC